MRVLTTLFSFFLWFAPLHADPAHLFYRTMAEHVIRLVNDQQHFCTAVMVKPKEFLTANHCLSTRLEAFNRLGYSLPADVVKKSEGIDLALIQVNMPNLTPIDLASEDTIPDGLNVVAMGFVSPFSEMIPMYVAAHVIGVEEGVLVLVDQPYRFGFSGGPLVNEKGQLEGLNVMTDVENQIGISVSIRVIRQFLK